MLALCTSVSLKAAVNPKIGLGLKTCFLGISTIPYVADYIHIGIIPQVLGWIASIVIMNETESKVN